MNKKHISDGDLINNLQFAYKEIGDVPSMRQYEKIGLFSANTYLGRFGTWKQSLKVSLGVTIEMRKKLESIKVNCLTCGEATSNPRYCSRTCAAVTNNKLFPKREKIIHKCVCGMITGHSSKFCKQCRYKRYIEEFGKNKIENFTSKYARHKYQAIRHHAHRIAKMNKIERKCVCGYTTYVELCHKKQISTFPKDAMLSEVNAVNNLIFLCPTHHWELDHDILNLVRETGVKPA